MSFTKAFDNNQSPKAIFTKDKRAKEKWVSGFIKKGFTIKAKGTIYKPTPNFIAFEATFNQFVCAIPEAINTVPQTGGVIVDKRANQKINRCAWIALKPYSSKIGPAIDTQIIYAAVVGTSIPKTKQAIAVRSKAAKSSPFDKNSIAEVILTPTPVTFKTPIIIPAQIITEAIVAICLEAVIQPSKNLKRNSLNDIFQSLFTRSKKTEAKIAKAAENWGVFPIIKRAYKSIPKGIAKKRTKSKYNI